MAGGDHVVVHVAPRRRPAHGPRLGRRADVATGTSGGAAAEVVQRGQAGRGGAGGALGRRPPGGVVAEVAFGVAVARLAADPLRESRRRDAGLADELRVGVARQTAVELGRLQETARRLGDSQSRHHVGSERRFEGVVGPRVGVAGLPVGRRPEPGVGVDRRGQRRGGATVAGRRRAAGVADAQTRRGDDSAGDRGRGGGHLGVRRRRRQGERDQPGRDDHAEAQVARHSVASARHCPPRAQRLRCA